MAYKQKQNSSYSQPRKSFYPAKIQPMLAQSGQKADLLLPKKKGQRKYDGTRVITIKDGANVKIMGARNWINDYAPNYPEIVDEIKQLPVERCIVDGELTFFEKGTDKDFFLSALAKPETKKGYTAKLMLFDALFVDDEDLQSLPFESRDEILKTLVPAKLKFVDPVLTVSGVGNEGLFKKLEKAQLEGMVVKDEDSPYRQGARTPEWLKVKNWKSDEAIVVGYTKGEGSRAGSFGALILAQKGKDGKLHYIGKAAGLKDSETRRLLAKMQALKTAKGLVADAPPDVNVKEWIKPQLVVEVKYLERTPKGVLRMPDFLRERTDKKPADVKLP